MPQGFSERLSTTPVLFLTIVACTLFLWYQIDSVSLEAPANAHVHGGAAEDAADGHRHGAQEPPHQHGPFHGTSEPPREEVLLVPEWEPVERVVVALPSTRLQDEAYLNLLADLCGACLQSPSVIFSVIVEQADVRARAIWEQLVHDRGLAAERTEVYEVAGLDSVWIRDYGPIFTRRSRDRGLIVVDTAYRDIRMEIERNGSADPFGPPLRPLDDSVPTYFATVFEMPYLHPGLPLNGGDVFSDGAGTAYTSEETLHLSTGDRQYVQDVFREYFGVDQVRFLRSLPGPTVKHLDMFFKLVSPKTCLLGEYRGMDGFSELACLQRAAGRILDENEARLEADGLTVVRLPMPDITRISKWDYYGRIFNDEDRDQRLLDLADEAGLTAEQMKRQLESAYTYVYRTFANSIVLTEHASTEDSARRVIIPSYTSGVPVEMFAQVQQAYAAAYGESTQFAFVAADALEHSNAALRCIVCPLPK